MTASGAAAKLATTGATVKTGVKQKLDPTLRSEEAKKFDLALRKKIIGQDAAIEKLVEIYQMFLAGLNPPNRPVGNLLFLGPTGSGKTRTVEAAAQTLFGDPRACLKVDCAEFQHSHEIAKLIGCFAKGTRVLMHDGSVKPIEKIKVGDRVITKTGEPQTVTFLHKYKYDGPMTVLNIANSNIPVVCTPQHKILAIRTGINGGRPTTLTGRDVKARYNPDKLDWVAASELKKGDIVVYPRQKFVWTQTQTEAEESLAMGAAAASATASSAPVPNASGSGLQSRGEALEVMQGIKGKVLDLADLIQKHGIKNCDYDSVHIWFKSHPLKRVLRFVKVDEKFARLAGYYVSEGGNSKSKLSVNFTLGAPKKEGRYTREIENLLLDVFEGGKNRHKSTIRDGKTRKGKTTKKTSVRTYFSSRFVAHLMADLFGDHTLIKHIPEWWFKLEPKLLWCFLDTLIGDGGKSVARRIYYGTSSETLVYQMRLLIHNLGFTTHIQKKLPKSWYNFKVSPHYRIFVSGDQIDKFVNNLPSVSNFIDLTNSGNSGIQRMSHVDENYVYNQIKSSKTTTNSDEFVYDFSVPGNTSYVVENNTIVSNSPPGYLGHRETHPMITQEALNQWHTPDLPLSLLLFDEIEKSSDSLWQLLLGILDKATLTLGDNRRVDLSSCIIVLTSNLGAADIMKLQEGGGLGFQPKSPVICDNFDKKIYDSAMSAAKKKFTPEFMNRIDKTVVFNTLRPEHLEEILEIELKDVQFRISVGVGGQQFAFKCLPKAKAALLIEGTDSKYGARHLKRAIERNLVFPLANLVATKQLKMGDSLDINYDGEYPNGHYTFTKTAEEIYTTSKAAASGSPSTQKIY